MEQNTIVRKNERSWAIEMISQINFLAEQNDLLIKRAGGETTISTSRKRMFPDVILYANKELTSILQGWELKMPDVPITDGAFVYDAQRKARTLGLNSCVIWNFTYIKFYILNSKSDIFEVAKQWENLDIHSREDVQIHRNEWEKKLKDVVITVNQYLINHKIIQTSISNIISNGAINLLINTNKDAVANYYKTMSNSDTVFGAYIDRWWKDIKDEYQFDETDKFKAYAKSIILNWAYRIIFAHLIKGHQKSAALINKFNYRTTPSEANTVFDEITKKCDFFNVFKRLDYNEYLPEDTWNSLIELSLFLQENGINQINQKLLQQILEGSVNTTRRELNGQFVTPEILARILVKITIHDWTSYNIDPCCGTGTIPHEIINLKRGRIGISKAVKTTWASDKYRMPLQIANISMTSYDTINKPNRLFQSDALNLHVGDEISIVNPQDGTIIKEKLPQFSAVCSNLPFVSSKNIPADDISDVNRLASKFKLDKKSDLCYYLAVYLSNIIRDGGYLGIITSNAWLGTKAGDSFYNAIRRVYNLKQVHISGYSRWFKNADVVTTILLLQKRTLEEQNDDHENHVSFFLWRKGLNAIKNDPGYEDAIVNSSLLDLVSKQDTSIVKRVAYSYEEIDNLHSINLSYNSLFHDVRWLLELRDRLIPIINRFNVIRGSRRGCDDMFFPKDSNIEEKFLKPALFNAKGVDTLVAKPDRQAFICGEELEVLADSYPRAYEWIEKFSTLKNGVGKPLPEVLKMPRSKWYELKPNEVVDLFTMMNPDERLFFGRFKEPTFINQRLIGLKPINKNEDIDLQHSLLNSMLMKFFIEAVGFGRGLGVLDINKDNISKCFMLNSDLLSNDKIKNIKDAFNPLISKKIISVESEMKDEDWIHFNHTVLESFNINEYYNKICTSLLSMRRTRKAVKINEQTPMRLIKNTEANDYRQSEPYNSSLAADDRHEQIINH